MGSGKDFESAGLRRLVINASYWCMGMEEAISAKSSVEYVRPDWRLARSKGSMTSIIEPAESE